MTTNQKGFTLVELLIVVVIIGILAAVSIPAYIGQRAQAARTEARGNLEHLRLLEEQYYAEEGEYTSGTLGTCAKDNSGNVAAIRAELPGFKPGDGLGYSYCIQGDKFIDTSTNTVEDKTGCFVAQAFGNSSSRVNGEEAWIDCENQWYYHQ